MAERRPRVVIAGASGAVGRALVKQLSSVAEVVALSSRENQSQHSEVSWLQVDGFSIPSMEIALAGAQVAVFLTKAQSSARLTQADLTDLDVLLADTLARAAPATSVKRLVMFSCGERDARELILRKSKLEVSVLRGGGTNPAEALAELVLADKPKDLTLGAASIEPRDEKLKPAMDVVSVQRFSRPAGWSASDIGYGYFSWASTLPLVRTERFENSITLRAAGIGALKVLQNHGRSSEDSCWFDVLDGALVKPGVIGHFEFRTLLDGDAMAALIGYSPRLPWFMYRMTQAIAHRMVMKRFGIWLSEQTSRPAA